MTLYLSRESLHQWADRKTLTLGRDLFDRGCVENLELGEELTRATIRQYDREVWTRFRILEDGLVESHCPCRYTQEQRLVCAHVVAAGFEVARLTEDSRVERRKRISRRRASNARRTQPEHGIQRRTIDAEGSIPARLRFRLDPAWQQQWEDDKISLTGQALYRDERTRLDRIPERTPLGFSEQDIELLYLMEDLADAPGTPGRLTLTGEEFLEFLERAGPDEVAVLDQHEPLKVEKKVCQPILSVSMNDETGELELYHTMDLKDPVYLLGRRWGWAFSNHSYWPLDAVLPAALRDAYQGGPALIARDRVMSFLCRDLPELEKRFLVENKVHAEQFSIREGCPRFEIELHGTPDSVETSFWAVYGETRVRAEASFGTEPDHFPVPGNPRAFFTRNLSAESDGLERLDGHEMYDPREKRFRSVKGAEEVMRVLAEVVPRLRQDGWTVTLGGVIASLCEGVEWVRPVINISESSTAGWFETALTFVDGQGDPVDPDEVEDALVHDRATLNQDGRMLLVNASLFKEIHSVYDECVDHGSTEKDRISDIHAGYLTGMLQSCEGVSVDADETWWSHARKQTEKIDLEPVEPGEHLKKILRPYQQEGVAWLHFLERGGYGGILADEMGLGKTIQALAWIQLERISESARGLPSLVVCPSSLVENWAREAARFTPKLSCLAIFGSDRHAMWDQIPDHDLVITSYALLRRDLARYKNRRFAIAVLDEAQHIKNRSTQNALGAKQINAHHRLVLTGTPMENSVNDLWSIMDFALPLYLGTHVLFREAFERPVSAGGERASEALRTLRFKMHPFMLRRLKADVAQDLPEKVTRLATCVMGDKQAARYRALANEYHNSLCDLVTEKGFNQARFSVLKILLRLRQLCCHPALLKEDGVDDEAHSAKLDLFFELLDEARDGGNRVLVFSQFVQMLKILRRKLDARSIPYAYLDGSTRKRQAEIDRFNENADIPLFLVSLKAGGTGLNLTGANVVIHFDPWWNPAVEDQATDRVHRIGQTRSVYSIKLITQGTVEEKVIELQERKRRMIDATVGRQGEPVSSLSWKDVEELLAL